MTGSQVMVVLIVAIVMFASIFKSKQGHQGRGSRRGREAALHNDGAENARLQAEVAELKKRLAVLERITVEKESSLERQIEALRDK
ncbi:MAG TPA: hypothetical protein VEZ70_09790 [Allosphingosinicella sp.]|nr:hypothetical protein [Allosphingosinicella sp.]